MSPSLAGADAVLALRQKVKQNAELRSAAREVGRGRGGCCSGLPNALDTYLGIMRTWSGTHPWQVPPAAIRGCTRRGRLGVAPATGVCARAEGAGFATLCGWVGGGLQGSQPNALASAASSQAPPHGAACGSALSMRPQPGTHAHPVSPLCPLCARRCRRLAQASVPIYAVKSSGPSNLVKAFRTLLGIDPSAGGTFGAPGSDSEDAPAAGASGSAGAGEGEASVSDSKGYSYKAWAEEEALQVRYARAYLPKKTPSFNPISLLRHRVACDCVWLWCACVSLAWNSYLHSAVANSTTLHRLRPMHGAQTAWLAVCTCLSSCRRPRWPSRRL